MYESLTRFRRSIGDEPGKWIIDREHDGKTEPKHVPYVLYSHAVQGLSEALTEFIFAHPDYRDYMEILKRVGINNWGHEKDDADVSDYDGKTVVALINSAFREDRFCEGNVLSYIKNGCIETWLKRLEEIDRE